eukprot:scaffold5380_cov131-Cylindrotheca_fusiformis.AAC.24
MDIATNGFSTTVLPKKHDKVLKKPQAVEVDKIVNKINFAIDEQEEIQQGLAARIFHTSRLATKIAKTDPTMAASFMKKVTCSQIEYVHVLRVKAGMKAFRQHVQLGLEDIKDVDKNLDELKNTPSNNTGTTATNEALLDLLESQKFFPAMDSNGKISFSEVPTFFSSSASRRPSATTSSTSSSSSCSRPKH